MANQITIEIELTDEAATAWETCDALADQPDGSDAVPDAATLVSLVWGLVDGAVAGPCSGDIKGEIMKMLVLYQNDRARKRRRRRKVA